MKVKKVICSVCGREPHSDDAGYGILFKDGDEILCKKKKYYGETIYLHYHDFSQIEDALCSYTVEDGGRYIRSTTAVLGICKSK